MYKECIGINGIVQRMYTSEAYTDRIKYYTLPNTKKTSSLSQYIER